MASSTGERNHILYMVESGKVTAAQAAQLLDSLAWEPEHSRERSRIVNPVRQLHAARLDGNRRIIWGS